MFTQKKFKKYTFEFALNQDFIFGFSWRTKAKMLIAFGIHIGPFAFWVY